jgi:hypothetical protein
MSAVASANSGVADLTQWLSSAESGISSAVSSTVLQSALKSASPVDLAQLSQQAVQLQEVSGLFGSSDTSQTVATAATPEALVLQALDSSISGSTTSLLG